MVPLFFRQFPGGEGHGNELAFLDRAPQRERDFLIEILDQVRVSNERISDRADMRPLRARTCTGSLVWLFLRFTREDSSMRAMRPHRR